MQTIKLANGITISYQDKGKKSAPTIILIMGLGAQMTIWPDELYYGLVKNGFRVIRFDNRDVGLSSQLDKLGNPSLFRAWVSKRLPSYANTPYNLEDMAGDVLALMAGLKIKKAHLVGASMGGMIAQIIAAKHKNKVLSLTSIMSSSSHSSLFSSNLNVLLKLAQRPKKSNREDAILYNVKMNRLIGSPAYPTDDLTLHQNAVRSIDRAYNPAGIKRQLAAITASGDRRHTMKNIKAHTLVIHGTNDPIIPVSGGRNTAALIKRSKLKVIDGMGHDFPTPLMTKMTKWISKHAKKADKKRLDKKRKKQADIKCINASLSS
ncbi:alpha/beta hydrolase [Paraglaciecola aquimarina]|uniref:Alpha/beta hydrolase n=1 Tax=Paraglaciecola algarum TaxID=3050085 RepID=A0ABS9D660_9ALTE|nr:alpha/beta hydrolase [Paraglaciecola sp. G1-23]MCF2947925.1 alpha/beta hydrolase [Paraglaciecola sp. G1-23]